MKINLLREEQMSEKVPHQKNEQMLEFGDSFESGSDDFYFRQPEPGGNEEYKPPRRRRFWVYILILLIVVFAGTYISNPAGTKSYIKDSARNVRNGWYRLTGNIQTWWLDRNNQDDFKTSAPEKPAETKEPEEVKKTEAVKIIQPVREVVEYNTLPSEKIYDVIRDDIALSKRNQTGAELFWAKIPAGVIVSEMKLQGDQLSFLIKSYTRNLVEQVIDEIEQESFFQSRSGGDIRRDDQYFSSGMLIDLPEPLESDRPQKLWDLDLKWLQGYMDIIRETTAIEYRIRAMESSKIDRGILRHRVNVDVIGSRAAMTLFIRETGKIPASFNIERIETTYLEKDYKHSMNLKLTYYERD